MTDITELAQSLKAAATNVKETVHIARYLKATIARQTFKELMTPDNILALVDALEKARQRIAELENNEIQEEGNQFLVVRHPGKVPVIKHPVGDLEDYLRQIFKADPLATIDIVTHRYYGVGGQFVEDADEYLHEMSIKVEAE